MNATQVAENCYEYEGKVRIDYGYSRKTAKATEETARNTKRLVTEFSGDGEMEFA